MPDIQPEDISERSKADHIAKAFVLSQITWFALQVIGRLASDILVTPLELHTLIHVACTIIMYILWMKKPYDVQGSILLTNPHAKDVAALFMFHTILSELHATAYSEYHKALIDYWKDRVVRTANNLLDHDPPPNPPTKELLTTSVSQYLSSEKSIPSSDSKHQLLMSLVSFAQRGIDTLRKHSHSTINNFK